MGTTSILCRTDFGVVLAGSLCCSCEGTKCGCFLSTIHLGADVWRRQCSLDTTVRVARRKSNTNVFQSLLLRARQLSVQLKRASDPGLVFVLLPSTASFCAIGISSPVACPPKLVTLPLHRLHIRLRTVHVSDFQPHQLSNLSHRCPKLHNMHSSSERMQQLHSILQATAVLSQHPTSRYTTLMQAM